MVELTILNDKRIGPIELKTFTLVVNESVGLFHFLSLSAVYSKKGPNVPQVPFGKKDFYHVFSR